jgi:hypothetical protein
MRDAVRAWRERSVILRIVRGDTRLRFAGLLGAGSLAVHQLRYAAGYGGESSRALADQGHGYLGAAGAVIALLLAVALGAFLGSLLRRRPPGAGQPRFGRLWLAAAGSLSAIYAGQELIEGALSSGHPEGVAGVVAGGGWTAFAIAALVGALIALAMRGADAVLGTTRPARHIALRPPATNPILPALSHLTGPAPAFASSPPARGPPAASV